ncbi:TPA: hypothetical protein QCR33_001020 [Bacillus cereus]|nr:hypothetical protein [Bacillus cereus]HDR4608695.1 hypothetical protein [Bacillus cereus]HDR4624547.1 hypothetical protein [Bacillus cereus]HDR4659259.1 hypothetical protein [Bacillus cereus]HDR4927148.1 hypothetical protein [Bacillus cereus]
MRDIFSYNTDINKNAYMNWRTTRYDHIHNMIVVAEGFKDSALLLVKNILKDNTDKKADNLIFPILFNANHSIEVYLKAICWTQNLLLNKNATFEGNHNLKGLFTKVVDLENELKSGNKEVFYEMLNNLKDYIDELYDKIERTVKDKKGNNKTIHDITFCRYSLNNDLEPQFYINTLDNVVVDLENFLIVFEAIFKNLDSLSMHYTNLLEDKLEAEYEAQTEFESDY